MKKVFDIIYNSESQYIIIYVITYTKATTYKYELYHNNTEIMSRETYSNNIGLEKFYKVAEKELELLGSHYA